MLNLDELLQGVLESLETDVAPNVSDRKAKAQLYACLDLLGNLAVKVDWKAQILRDECDGIRSALTRAAQLIAAASPKRRVLSEVSAAIAALPSSDARQGSDETVDWFARRRRYAQVFEDLVRAVGDNSPGSEGAEPHGVYDELRECVHEHLVNQTIRDAFYLKPMRLSEMSKG